MISPSARLLWFTGLTVLPASTMGAAFSSPALLGLAGLCIFAAGIDAALSLRKVRGLRIGVPGVIRLSEGREGHIPVEIENTSEEARTVKFALVLPGEVGSLEETLMLPLPSGERKNRLSWPCRPRRRGKFGVSQCCLGEESPLRLWTRRVIRPLKTEVRIYPNLLRERRDLGGLLARRGAVGIHTRNQVGRGREFEKLREYEPGDSYEDIHWKATAKRASPVTKVYQIERTQEVYVILDGSRLSARPAPRPGADGTRRDVLDHFIDAALALAAASERQGDLFGLLAFSDRVDHFLRAGGGRRQHIACLDILYTLRPSAKSPDFDELASFIRIKLRRRALLIFLTSLDDPALTESLVGSLDLFRRQHLVIAASLKPPYSRPLFSGPGVKSQEELYGRLAGHIRWRRLRETGKVLQRRGVPFVELENEKLCPELVGRYLEIKRRQLL